MREEIRNWAHFIGELVHGSLMFAGLMACANLFDK